MKVTCGGVLVLIGLVIFITALIPMIKSRRPTMFSPIAKYEKTVFRTYELTRRSDYLLPLIASLALIIFGLVLIF